MISAELQKAIDNLHIHDVYVRNLAARCIGDFEPKYDANIETLAVQFKYNVKQSVVGELDNKNKILRVVVDVGARWVDEKIADEASSVKAIIEAEFIAEYLLKSDLKKACIDEFSLQNVAYHVWPYWLELLTSQCSRMHLPRVMLPTVQLAHNRHAELSHAAISDS